MRLHKGVYLHQCLEATYIHPVHVSVRYIRCTLNRPEVLGSFKDIAVCRRARSANSLKREISIAPEIRALLGFVIKALYLVDEQSHTLILPSITNSPPTPQHIAPQGTSFLSPSFLDHC